jgi:Protein of unknown function (DUF2812).
VEFKIVKTGFSLSDFEEEEKWLSQMHKEGWKLIEISRNHYKFEECQPEDWVYQLDFQVKNIAENSYLKLYNDYGWNFILQNNDWFYFRKQKELNDTDLSIFSDRNSMIAMCERVINRKLLFNVILFAIACVIVILTIFTQTFSSDTTILIPKFTWINDFLKAALPWVGIGLFVATSYSFSDYTKIRNKINRMKNPLE